MTDSVQAATDTRPAAAVAESDARAPESRRYADSHRKSPFLACVLSAMPGLGQVYVGYYQRGFIHALVVAVLITLMVNEVVVPLLPLASIFLAFFVLYNIIDAGRLAALYNRALEGGLEIDLPDEIHLAGLRGSLLGGSVLVGVGFVLLLHTLFGMSLDWISDWWPVAFIAFGAYLVKRALAERADGGEKLSEAGTDELA